MIGVTATAGAVIYYGRGQLIPAFAAAAVLGVQLGSWGGMRFGARASAKWAKLVMGSVLFAVSVLMFVAGAHCPSARIPHGSSELSASCCASASRAAARASRRASP